jgi:hypothetical protein
MPTIKMRQVFSVLQILMQVQVLVVNTGDETRNLLVKIPKFEAPAQTNTIDPEEEESLHMSPAGLFFLHKISWHVTR